MAIFKLGTPTGVILRINDAVTLTNSAAEFTLISYMVVGGTMSMTNEVSLAMDFALTTRALLPGNLTIRLKYGSSVLTLGGGALTLLGGATNTPFRLSGILSNKSTTSAQFLRGEIRQGSGGLSLGQPVSLAFIEPTVDSTQDQLFSVTAQFSAADASNTLILKQAKAELS